MTPGHAIAKLKHIHEVNAALAKTLAQEGHAAAAKAFADVAEAGRIGAQLIASKERRKGRK